MTRLQPRARAARPGVAVSAFVLLCLIGPLLGACGEREPAVPTERRVWEGGTLVSSSGVVVYDRREIAQKVTLPACITVGENRYRFDQVTTFADGATPPGLADTFYRLDRWRLWTRPGALEGQPMVFVTVRGSTGILGEYQRAGPGEPCS